MTCLQGAAHNSTYVRLFTSKPHSLLLTAKAHVSRASEIALRLWERHGLAVPVDLQGLAVALGIEVVSFPFRGRLEEVIIDGTIGIRRGLDRRWFRWRVAHGIGHHQLHTGVRARSGGCAGCDGKAERQAEEFAASLVAGPDGWDLTSAELAIPAEKLLLVRRVASPPGS